MEFSATNEPAAPGEASFRRTLLLCALALAAAVLAYQDVGRFGFCDLDDSAYVTENRLVLSGLSWETVRQAFVPDAHAYLSPLVTLSFMLDGQLFGLWAGGFHLVNLLWHCANVALFFLLVLRLSGSRAAALLAGLLLAAHPAHIEAVAWISARKDMISTFFGLCAINIYIGWARKPSALRNIGLHACHGLSLLAKPMLATLPGLLLLLDFWPLRRLGEGAPLLPGWRRGLALVREKLLLLALGLLATFVTVRTHFEAYDRLDPDFGLKLANGLAAYAKYLGLLVWPHDQAIVYPFPASVPLAHSMGAALLLAALTGLCLWQRRQRPYLLVGWLWFLVSLLPVIAPPKVGLHVALADRWAYVPFMGLYLALGCLVAEGLERLARVWKAALCAVLVAWAALLMAQHQRQLATWATPVSIYEQALRVTTDSHVVLNNYGGLKAGEGDDAAAEAAYLEALRIHPRYGMCLFNLGLLRMRQERYPEALGYLARAGEELGKIGMGYEPARAMAYCLAKMGRTEEAQELYAMCVQLQPERVAAYLDWAKLAASLGRTERARALYRKSQEIAPGNPAAREGLAALDAAP